MWHGFDMYGLIYHAVSMAFDAEQVFEETYATVGTVCATPLLRRLVDLNVLDNQVASVQTLGIRIRLSVLEQAE